MITLFRMIRLWQLRIKWQLALMQFLDNQLMDFIKNPEELEKKLTASIASIVAGNRNDTTAKC